MRKAIKFIAANVAVFVCFNIAHAGQSNYQVVQAGGSATGGDSINSTRTGVNTDADKGTGAITTDPNRNKNDVDDMNSPNPKGIINNERTRKDRRQTKAKDGIRNHSPDRLNEHPIGTRPEDPSRDGPRPR